MGEDVTADRAHWLDEDMLEDASYNAQVTWTRDFVRQIATTAAESTKFQEAVRMLVTQGIWLRRMGMGAQPTVVGPTYAEPQDWFEQIQFDADGEVKVRVELTRGTIEDMAEVAPNQVSIQETVWLLVSLAIGARQADAAARAAAE